MNVEEGTTNSPAPDPAAETTTTETAPQTEAEKTLVTQEEKPAVAAEEFTPLTADDITFPENFEVDEGLRDEALSVFNNRDLSPKEQMQALVDLQLRAVEKASETSSRAWTEMQDKWQGEVKADPEIGGDKLQPTLARVQRLVAEYGPKGLGEVFDMTGAGNNPLMIKFLNNVASKLVEGGAVQGAPANGQTESVASRMFPSMKG